MTVRRCLIVLLSALAAGSARAQSSAPVDLLAQQRAHQRYREGQDLLLRDAYAEAAVEFRAAIALDRTMALAHYGLGQALMGQRDYEEAIQAFRDCRAAYQDLSAATFERGERLNRWLDAEVRGLKDVQQQIEARLRQGGANPQLQRELTRVTQRIDQIERLRQRGASPATVPAGVELALGSAYLRAGHLPEAERQYLLAIEGNPRMGEAHNNLAYVYMVTGRLQDAERAMKLAERSGFHVNPDFKAELKQKLQ